MLVEEVRETERDYRDLVQRLGGRRIRVRSQPSGRDLTLAAGLLAVGLVEAAWATSGQRPLALTLVLPLTIPLAWRSLHPRAVALTVTTAFVVQLPWAPVRLFDQTFTGFVCVLLAAYALGRQGRARWRAPTLTACALAVATVLGWYDRSVGTFLLGVVFVLAPAAAGRVVAARAGLRDLLDRQAEMVRQNAEVAERARVVEVRGRIAAEVQDLVSRRVSGMVDRCKAAGRLAHDGHSAEAAELVATVEADGRAAMDEMRRVLGFLRSTDLGDSSSVAPEAEDDHEPGRVRHLSPRRVETVLLAAFIVLLLGEALASPDGVPLVAVTLLVPVLTFAVGARTTGRTAVLGLALALLAAAAVGLLVGEGGWGDYAFPTVLVAMSWLGGRLVREQNDLVEQSRRRAVALERGVHVRAAAAAAEERLRLARELHDVLSHTLMVMVVQAGAARRSLESGRPGAEEALRVIEDTGRGAAMELRRLLALVDPEGASTSPDPESPGVGDLEPLIDRARAAGLAADLVVEGAPTPVPGGLGLAVYRVAQEALTNVIRHADAQHVSVRLRYEPRGVQLEIRDDGRAVSDPSGSPWGNGLAGMRERVGMYGGELHAGPSPLRGFVVSATFPLVEPRQEQPA